VSWASRQVPRPSHVWAVLSSTSPEQVAVLQTVSSGNKVQVPNPSHSPVLPQVLRSSALQAESDWPASRNLHRPTEPAWLHETQGPLHETLQHTPSEEKPETHWALLMDLAPLSFSPQLWATHSWPAAHWAFVLHSMAHSLVAESQV